MIDSKILSDALCNAHYSGLGIHPHANNRYRGIEGRNGVACDYCQKLAERAIVEYQRIRAGLKLTR